MRITWLLAFWIAWAALAGCHGPLREVGQRECGASDERAGNAGGEKLVAEAAMSGGGGALLATRFASLEALKSVAQITYFTASGSPVAAGEEAAGVRVTHCSHGHEVVGILAAGISQGDIMKAQNGSLAERVGLVVHSPYAVANRADLQTVINLARRRPDFFGEGDVAFFDFAETMVGNINTADLAFGSPADTSEKGYLNTFNHITAQAFICSFFSEELADFVADMHERLNMPELVTGKFAPAQLTNPDNNPVDNYVDVVNNEWGQELGKQLRAKYHLSRDTWWTPRLLADYLNDIQAYYSWVLEIGFQPFQPEDDVVVRFSKKINHVMQTERTGG